MESSQLRVLFSCLFFFLRIMTLPNLAGCVHAYVVVVVFLGRIIDPLFSFSFFSLNVRKGQHAGFLSLSHVAAIPFHSFQFNSSRVQIECTAVMQNSCSVFPLLLSIHLFIYPSNSGSCAVNRYIQHIHSFGTVSPIWAVFSRARIYWG